MPTFLEVAGTLVPSSVEGRSILPLLKGETADWRSYYHGEHSPCYHAENANQFLTDGHWKYIWNPINGEEQLFYLDEDPHECRNLANVSDGQGPLEKWRQRLVRQLTHREEGLSDGQRLTLNPVPVWRGGDPDDVHLG